MRAVVKEFGSINDDSTTEKSIGKKQHDIHLLLLVNIFAWIDVIEFIVSFDTTNCVFPTFRDLGVMCRSKLVSSAYH